ncbi:TIGR01777 family oxidoreductase [Fredinandcohnia sp. QZ13]|uniref:TIGR01777 family oxidoreductase n=1 Tax=Fredinandcohnia sp. QZ13 TaxID=3073144 RepID=UPI0028536BCB|nr:TIGR01777 family oxidoreductase [Fredinandcohnia sp. QZ13]MDR4886226.1 TIGR01777 family oxidoreductase [Fredinandcohnia sp. QZ13]
MKKVVLAGGTGFVGTYFLKRFSELGYVVNVISRNAPNITWDDRKGIIEALEDSEILINLAGKSVNCRYNEKNKQEILHSRTETTKILGDALKECKNPPKLWINSSTATIYRHAEDRPMTEESGEIGTGFSVDVAKRWEEAFFSYQFQSTRQVALRISIVLGAGGGVMIPYKNLVRFGLGGIQGHGTQKFSWIHIEDLFNIVLYIRDHPHLAGVFNCSTPNPITNRELMNSLRGAYKRKFGLPSPAWLLEIGAIFIRTETELILKSRWVIPERLIKEGYIFSYPTIEDALTQITKNN